MSRNRNGSFSAVLYIILLCLSIFGIWLLYKKYVLQKKQRQLLLSLEENLVQANLYGNTLLGFQKYFAYRDEQQYAEKFAGLRKQILTGFEDIGLDEQFVAAILKFTGTFDEIAEIRKVYNDEFVKQETNTYRYLFDILEDYPLSTDQVEAVIRDEDNNLVLAGAGTGKTTTISAKVAYILEKKLATPEELLIISFTKNAVTEMYDRCLKFCRHIPGAEHLDVRTFNSFGYLVNRQCSQQELHLAFGGEEDAAKAFLQETFDKLFLEDADFQRKATNFIAFFNRPERDEFKFETKDAFIKHEQSFKNETLDGKKVNSKEEMEIGNFFCLFGIDYEYERHYPLEPEDRNADYSSYHPDFFLTEYDIWHEHFGVDREGNVPQWFKTRPPYPTAKEYYQAGMNWKRGVHAKYGTSLIETYSFESAEDSLISGLKKKLMDRGVLLEPRKPEEILPMIKKSAYYEDFINLFHTFLGLMKSNAKTPNDIIGKGGDRRLRVFMDVFRPVYNRYEALLRQSSQVDFNDMINLAADHIATGSYGKPYKYILVDEFQDMSLGRYELIKSLKKQNPGVKLYAVGDDWQSIFRFTGSDISIITEFGKHFGYTSKTSIFRTYRFNDEILQVSSEYIQKNPAQLRKTLFSERQANDKSFEFIASNVTGPREAHQQAKDSGIRSALSEISARKQDAKVFLIGRYRLNIPEGFAKLKKDYPLLTLEYYTAHKVKGMTCDYAILLDINSGILGFPSEVADDPLLNYLLHEGDSFENAEERRVFYVAITRARHKNFLLYNSANPSKFLSEIKQDSGDLEESVAQCPECSGPVVKRKGPYSEFWGCSNFPLCNGKIAMSTVVGNPSVYPL